MTEIDKLLKEINGVSAAAEKYSKKYNIPKTKNKNISTVANDHALKFYARASKTMEDMAKQSMRISALTAKKSLELATVTSKKAMDLTKENLKNLTYELSKDFAVDTKNVLAQALARSSPIFGYAITRALNTEMVKRLASQGWEGTKNIGKKVGSLIKDQFGETKEKISTAHQKAIEKKKDKELIKKVEGIVPKLAIGGYLKKDALIKAHKGEVVAPVEKIIEPLERIAKDIHRLVKDFKSYMAVNQATIAKSVAGEAIGIGDLPPDTPSSIKKALTVNKIKGGFSKFMDTFIRRQLTDTQTFVKSALHEQKSGLVKSFISAYREVNNDYEAPYQERMLRATLEIKGALTSQRNQWKLIHESMIAQSRAYRYMTISYRMIKKSLFAPLRIAYRFFKKKGGYAARLPKNAPAQEMTASILGSIYVDSMVKYDAMIENQLEMIKLLGGSRFTSGGMAPPAKSRAQKFVDIGTNLFNLIPGVHLTKGKLEQSILEHGVLRGSIARYKEWKNQKAEEKEYIMHGPQKRKLTLLECCIDQLDVLRKIRDLLAFNIPPTLRKKFLTKGEKYESDIEKERKLSPKQRARLLAEHKLKQKYRIGEKSKELEDRIDDLLYSRIIGSELPRKEYIKKRIKTTSKDLNKELLRSGVEKWKTRGELGVTAATVLERKVKKKGYVVGNFMDSFKEKMNVKNMNSPIEIFKSMREKLSGILNEEKKQGKKSGKIWGWIKKAGGFLFGVLGKIKNFLLGGIGGLLGGGTGGLSLLLKPLLGAAVPLILTYAGAKIFKYFWEKKKDKELKDASKKDYSRKEEMTAKIMGLDKTAHSKMSALINTKGLGETAKFAHFSTGWFSKWSADPMIAEKIKYGRQKVFLSSQSTYDQYSQEELLRVYNKFNDPTMTNHPVIGNNEDPEKYGKRYENEFLKFLKIHGQKGKVSSIQKTAENVKTSIVDITKKGIGKAKTAYKSAKEKGKQALNFLQDQKDYYQNQLEVLQIKAEYWWTKHKDQLLDLQWQIKNKAEVIAIKGEQFYKDQKKSVGELYDYIKNKLEVYEILGEYKYTKAKEAFMKTYNEQKDILTNTFEVWSIKGEQFYKDQKKNLMDTLDYAKHMAEVYQIKAEYKFTKAKQSFMEFYTEKKDLFTNTMEVWSIKGEQFYKDQKKNFAETWDYVKHMAEVYEIKGEHLLKKSRDSFINYYKDQKDVFTNAVEVWKIKGEQFYKNQRSNLEDTLDFLTLQSEIFEIHGEQYLRQNYAKVKDLQTKIRNKLIEYQSKATATEIPNEGGNSQTVVKIDTDKLIIATKMTAKELASTTGKAVNDLVESGQKNINNLTHSVVNSISNITTNNQTNNNIQGNQSEIDPAVHQLITGDLT